MKEYTATFIMDGQPYCMSVWAEDWADAEKRARAMEEGIRIDGECGGVIESTPEEAERMIKWADDQRKKRGIG